MPQRAAGSRLEKFRQLSILHMTYMKYAGLWALPSDSSTFSKCLYYVYNKLMLTIMIGFAATLLADIFVSFDDLSIVSDDGCIFAGITVIIFKAIIIQFHREQINRLFSETIENCYQLCEFPSGVENEILDWYLLLSRATFCGFGMLGFFLVIAVLFFVPVENGQLPVRARFPVDTSQPPWHAFGYLVEICSISVGMIAIMGTDSLLCNLCNLFLAQLNILNVHFRNCEGGDRRQRVVDSHDNADGEISRREIFASSPVTVSRKKNDYECANEIRDRRRFAERFVRTVRGHQRLRAIIDDFNEVFSAGMFVQMLSSTMIICLTGFQAVLVAGQNSSTYKFLIYLAAAVLQLFYVCWLGNEVMHQSASLPQNQWMSEWSDVISADTGRLLIPSMIFAKRTLNMRAGAFYVLSMKTFIAIMRGAYSFFALLSTMRSEADQ